MRLFVQVLVVGVLGSIALNGLASPGRLEVGADALSVATHCRGDIDDPHPGDMICISGKLAHRLQITVGGTPEAPIVYAGGGDTEVPGITVEADNVVVQGFVSDGANSNGIWSSGSGVTIQDNTITHVRWTGDDMDGIRFFGCLLYTSPSPRD